MPDLGWSAYIDGVEQASEWKFLTGLRNDLAHLYHEYPWARDAKSLLYQIDGRLVRKYLSEQTDQMTALKAGMEFNRLTGRTPHGEPLRFFEEWSNMKKKLDELITKYENEDHSIFDKENK